MSAKSNPRAVKLLFGMPADKSRDDTMFERFFSGTAASSVQPLRIVCGGTTAARTAAYLGRELTADCEYPCPDIPPRAYIDGVAIVTEGVFTVRRAAEIMELYSCGGEYKIPKCPADPKCGFAPKCPALEIAAVLINAECVEINVGSAVNPSHSGSEIDGAIGVRYALAERMRAALERLGADAEVIRW